MVSKGEWSLKELAETLNTVAKTDKDNIVPIDGSTGSGKSTIGIKLCIKGCPWFDIKKDILYSRDEVIEWVTNAKPGSWGLADEAINILFKRDFAAKQQKFLLRIIDMCRERNLTIFMCIPNFWALDKHVLEGRVRLRIHVSRTGLAFMWKPSNNPFTPDRWYRKYNEKVCYNWDTYPNAKRTKGFIGYLKFEDLAEKYKRVYLDIKKRKKQEFKEKEEGEEKKGDMIKQRSLEFGKLIMLSTLIKKGLLVKGALKLIAEIDGVKQSTLSMRIKNFQEKHGDLSEASIQPIQEETLYNINDDNGNSQGKVDGVQHSAI